MELLFIIIGITFGILILVKYEKYNCSRNRSSAESEIGEIQDIDENNEYSENNKENDKSDNSNQNINNNDEDDELPSYSELYPK